MKLRQEEQVGFWFTAESFEISFPNGVLFSGKSINDILYIWISPAIHIDAVVTHNAFKRAVLSNMLRCEQWLRMVYSAIQATSGIFASAMHPAQRFTNIYISDQTMTLHTALYAFKPNKLAKPFRPAENKVTRKIEHIHSDICGPYPTSKGKSVYILTFLDEYTHWCRTITIPDKSSATIYWEYRHLIKQIDTESELIIKYLRTDGGGEYEGALRPVFEDLGIKHEPPSPHSPQSNAKAERFNHTLNNHASAMLYRANMPKSFWPKQLLLQHISRIASWVTPSMEFPMNSGIRSRWQFKISS